MYTLATRAPCAPDRAPRRSDRCSRLASIGRGTRAGDRGSRTGDRCSRTGEVKTRHKMTSTFKKNKRALIAGWGSGTTGRGPLGAVRFKRSTARASRACLTGKTTGKKKPARGGLIDRSGPLEFLNPTGDVLNVTIDHHPHISAHVLR